MKVIKKIWIGILLSACMLCCSCSYSNQSAESYSLEPIAKKELKIGFVHYSDPSDQGYTYNQDCATWKMVEELGLNKSQIINKYNVPETAEAATAMRELAEDGCQVIFATAHGHEDYMIQVAHEYPNITFCQFNGVQAESSGLKNMHDYYGLISQVRYLSGVVAGMTTKTNKIGFVASMDYSQVDESIDAFYLGAKSVNSSIQMYAVYLNTWYNPTLEAQATQSLIDKGCDVISHHADSTAGATTCEKNGCLFIPYNSDMSQVAPDAVLTSVRWDTSSYLVSVIKAVMEGRKDKIPTSYFGTLEDGMVYLGDLNTNLLDDDQTKKIQKILNEDTQKFEEGDLFPFIGPLYGQDGDLILEKGKTYQESDEGKALTGVIQSIHIMK